MWIFNPTITPAGIAETIEGLIVMIVVILIYLEIRKVGRG